MYGSLWGGLTTTDDSSGSASGPWREARSSISRTTSSASCTRPSPMSQGGDSGSSTRRMTAMTASRAPIPYIHLQPVGRLSPTTKGRPSG
jgi:hypothetical protein